MMGYLGEIKNFASDFSPSGHILCDGRRLNKSQYLPL
jgi:microcystin-dependent protein